MENYKTRITPAKEDAVKALKDEFAGYDSFIFTDYRGMTVEQITALRKTLRKQDAAYRVVKNRYAKIAFNDLEKGGADDQMVGPTAVALIKGDTANSVAKALFQANKDGVTITVKGALVGGELMKARAHLLSHGDDEGTCTEACRYSSRICRVEGWCFCR